MLRKLLLISAAAAATALAGSASASAEYVPGEVVVRYKDDTTGSAQAAIASAAGVDAPKGTADRPRRVRVAAGETVREATVRLRRDPRVAWARPNYVARIAYAPNDPTYARQWNFHAGNGINMPVAWDLARAYGTPGGRGTVVAVIDTGVAYQHYRRFRRAPDLHRFVPGYDFVDGDIHPNDEHGHGTHVAGTIAQTTDNGVGAAGIAYQARIMPIRVLNAHGETRDSSSIAKAIRFAARHDADVINLSLEFGARARASEFPDIVSALSYARRRGVVVVAAAGNESLPVTSFPARSRDVIAVGATTTRGCLADYSSYGRGLDIVAPGGGIDAPFSTNPYDAAVCRPELSGPSIFQQTFASGPGYARFALPRGWDGTSMAAPHVAGTAALVIATGRLGLNPSADAVERQLERTARDIGRGGRDSHYGHGLLDAAAALRPPTR